MSTNCAAEKCSQGATSEQPQSWARYSVFFFFAGAEPKLNDTLNETVFKMLLQLGQHVLKAIGSISYSDCFLGTLTLCYASFNPGSNSVADFACSLFDTCFFSSILVKRFPFIGSQFWEYKKISSNQVWGMMHDKCLFVVKKFLKLLAERD